MSDYKALAVRIREYLFEITKVVERAEMLSEKATTTNDDGYWDGVALNLHSFYSGIERVFEDIARTIDESTPSAFDWHRSLLAQMGAAFPDRRPLVISQESKACLDDYRAFRHVVRNVYAFNFRPARLKELTEGLRECFALVERDLLNLITFLENAP